MTTSHQKEQAERIAYAGSTTGMTYHSRAITGLDLERSGRHAQHATVIGSKPAVAYPRMPEGSPWHSDLVPPEGPTGYAIDAQEPVGEVFEIEASLREASPSVASLPPDGDVATARTTPSAGAKEASAVSTSAADASNFICRARKL